MLLLSIISGVAASQGTTPNWVAPSSNNSGTTPKAKGANATYATPEERKTMEIVFIVIIILEIILVIWAIYKALGCNPHSKIGYGILAFLFPEIYLAQYYVKKYVTKSPNYCLAFNPMHFDKEKFIRDYKYGDASLQSNLKDIESRMAQ